MHETLKAAVLERRGMTLSAEDAAELLELLEEARRDQVGHAVLTQRARDAERRMREYAQNLTLRLGSIQAVAKQAAEHGLRPDDLDHIIRLADPPKPPADNEARTTP